MRAVTLVSDARGRRSLGISDIDDPRRTQAADVLVETLEVGVCGTDYLLLHDVEGEPPPGTDRLIVGHEVLGRVLSVGSAAGLRPGDLVGCRVRLPDPVPCAQCAVGHQDMCENGRWTERGIRREHGFMAERWVADRTALVPLPAGLRDIGVLLEPASVVVKVLRRMAALLCDRPAVARVLVMGVGPIGLLAGAFLAANGHLVVCVDREPRGGLRSAQVSQFGRYIEVGEMDEHLRRSNAVIEASGSVDLFAQAVRSSAPNCVLGVLGSPAPGTDTTSIAASMFMHQTVQLNRSIVGSVNASMDDLRSASRRLSYVDMRWPGMLATFLNRISPTSHVRMSGLQEGYPDGKTVVDFTANW